MLVYLILIIGFVFMIKGADLLIDGSSSLAKRFKISDIFIGLTIVAFGTSAPELTINLISNFRGSSDIAIGNILGACIANILLIAGVAAIIYPIKIKEGTAWKEIPLALAVIILFFFLANDGFAAAANKSLLSGFDGAILLVFFAVFMYYIFGINKVKGEENLSYEKFKTSTSIVYIIIGIVGLGLGGHWVVNSAVTIARNLGLSEVIIGLTVISIGTTLPELIASVIAVMKRSADIAIGNIIGSTIFNVSLILGVSALIRPLAFNPSLNLDIAVSLLATSLLFFFALAGKKKSHISRLEGMGLLSAYIIYILFLVWRG